MTHRVSQFKLLIHVGQLMTGMDMVLWTHTILASIISLQLIQEQAVWHAQKAPLPRDRMVQPI